MRFAQVNTSPVSRDALFASVRRLRGGMVRSIPHCVQVCAIQRAICLSFFDPDSWAADLYLDTRRATMAAQEQGSAHVFLKGRAPRRRLGEEEAAGAEDLDFSARKKAPG